MEKKYDPQKIETPIYEFWKKSNYFKPNTTTNYQKSYCIMMPPPNITGELHLGHAFQQTIMDILVRFHRMKGRNTLWMVGFDHAGIATQISVENHIYKTTGKLRKDYTKEFLLQTIWKWKEQKENSISYQMQRLGNSIDWDSKRFTMDPEMSFSVKEAFIRLYNNNLIYKRKRLVNWDFQLQTAISDLEVSHKQIPGYIWYLRYKLAEVQSNLKTNTYITIATTRPETIFGDTAIAVHPQDSRYCNLIGKYVLIPIINRLIPIIADTRIDITKGTGCVKITPAHDFNDYAIGKQHKLSMINIFSVNRKILKKPEVFNSEGQPQKESNYYYIPEIFHDLNYDQARKAIIEKCNQLHLLEDTKTNNLTIPYNDRTGTIIEPMLTDQWYIKSKYLAKQAIYIVKHDIIRFIPTQYKTMYFKWMENIQDWCISRQIHWGHEIPAWYDDKNNKIYVGHSEKDIRLNHKLGDNIILRKDHDVLDTWFSSSLWTFSSLGWPVNTHLLNIFHPTNIIVSGFDIIFFWIARMIMMTMYLVHDNHKKAQIPFNTVYITGLVRDELGQKMSKSKGNTLDPLDIIDGISIENLLKKRTQEIKQPKLLESIIKYTKKNFSNGIKPHGADSLRLTLTALASSGRDIHWDTNRLTGYHNFCNKLWNVSKFVLMNTTNQDCGIYTTEKLFSLPDRWITTKLNQTIQKFNTALQNYRFDKIINILYEFIWNQFCDWYVEFSKPILYNETNIWKLRGTRYTLITSLEILLRLSHPIIPFITEKIWQKVKTVIGINGESIMLQSFPTYQANIIDLSTIESVEWIKNVIFEIRALRSHTGLSNKTPLKATFICNSEIIKQRVLDNNLILIKIAQLAEINCVSNNNTQIRSLMIPLDKSQLFIHIPKDFDKNIAINRFSKKINLLNHKINIIQKKINNINYYNNIPNNLFIKEQEKLIVYNNIKNKLLNQYDTIKIL